MHAAKDLDESGRMLINLFLPFWIANSVYQTHELNLLVERPPAPLDRLALLISATLTASSVTLFARH